jgi:hypothetical protein
MKKIIGYHLKNKSCPLPINGIWYKNYMLTQVCCVFRTISFLVYFFFSFGSSIAKSLAISASVGGATEPLLPSHTPARSDLCLCIVFFLISC